MGFREREEEKVPGGREGGRYGESRSPAGIIGKPLVSQTNFSKGISCELRITKLIFSTVFFHKFYPEFPQKTTEEASFLGRGKICRGSREKRGRWGTGVKVPF